MFERFTQRARRAIFFARLEASKTGSNAISPAHLLLGLMYENMDLLPEFPPGVNLDAIRLSEMVDRPVIDHTGLIEKYDGTLESAPTDAEILTIFGGERPPDGAASGPSIFTALQEQMGLKLAPLRGSVEYLVVEHAEQPSEN
jgi:hypothetical protein